jgi:hypothetical protein
MRYRHAMVGVSDIDSSLQLYGFVGERDSDQ